MDFAESCRYLLSLGHETMAMKFGLANVTRLLALLGDPHKTYAKIQIAGTNGKGSTAAMLASICRAAGIRAGLYTSPHLVSITERIRCNETEISQAEFADCASRVRFAAERVHMESGALPTFFEQVTAIAFLYFSLSKVELAILETGLGGRLDATTAAGAETAVITPIGLDHQDYLGTTLKEIAAEKAAIIHPGCRVAITAVQRDDVSAVLRERARDCNVELREACGEVVENEAFDTGRLRVTFSTRRETYREVRLALRGRHQIANALLAITVAESLLEQGWEISSAEVCAGLENAVHSGRLELVTPFVAEPPILLDGAHNADGAEALAAFLREFAKVPVTFVFGAMEDKDLRGIAAKLFPLAERLVLTPVDSPRSASPAALFKTVPAHAPCAGDITIAENSSAALDIARRITPRDGLICVTGSLYLIGEVKGLLQAFEQRRS